jgi:two-component system, OmpR family, response regulator QseB
MRILLVEDNASLASGLKVGLEQHDYTVDWCSDGKTALQFLLSQTDTDRFDVMILDLGLPRLSGFDILKTIRANNIRMPVLILTANDSMEDKVKTLDLGADDYISKPFDLGELCARLRALIRRGGGSARAIPTITIGSITLDPAARRVFKDGAPIELSRREFVLLHLLLENINKALSREFIVQNIYGWGDDVDSNALEVHIHNIRKKLGTPLITTVRGTGYMIEDLARRAQQQQEGK